jgi:hypothetical protein
MVWDLTGIPASAGADPDNPRLLTAATGGLAHRAEPAAWSTS